MAHMQEISDAHKRKRVQAAADPTTPHEAVACLPSGLSFCVRAGLTLRRYGLGWTALQDTRLLVPKKK